MNSHNGIHWGTARPDEVLSRPFHSRVTIWMAIVQAAWGGSYRPVLGGWGSDVHHLGALHQHSAGVILERAAGEDQELQQRVVAARCGGPTHCSGGSGLTEWSLSKSAHQLQNGHPVGSPLSRSEPLLFFHVEVPEGQSVIWKANND